MKKHLSKLLAISAFAFCLQSNSIGQGTWNALTNAAPDGSGGQMVLLTDGTVMCLSQRDTISNSGIGNVWDLLTPDIHGSYTNGTWSRLPAMHNTRMYMGCQVLANGNVYVAGGEFGTGGNTGEVFNTTTKKWTLITGVPNGWSISDGSSELLYDGTVLQGVKLPTPSVNTLIFNYNTMAYTVGTPSIGSHDDASWVKLPDSSIMNVDMGSQVVERYVNQLPAWLADASVSTKIYDATNNQTGPGFLLPNGQLMYFGNVLNTAYYTPSGNQNPGVWATGPAMPKHNSTQLGCTEAGAAMMANGKILCCMSPAGTTNSPTYFYTFDYSTNSFTNVLAPSGIDSMQDNSRYITMLDLPDGTVMLSHYGINGENVYYQFTPTGNALAAGKPVIDKVAPLNCSTYMVTGKLFNGISEGASYGDDWAMASNYPIIRLTDGTNVYYAKSTNWNRIGAVMTDSLPDTAYFTLPTIPAGTYSLVVVANGNPSKPTLFTPFEGTASVTANVSCHGNADGNATATVGGGKSPYTYDWSNGTTTVSTSNPTGATLSAGSYTLTVTDNLGCTKTASLTITEPATLTATPRIVKEVSCHGGSNGSVGVTAAGGTGPYTYAWSGGSTAATESGLSIGTYSVMITDANGCTATAAPAAITQPTALGVTAAFSEAPFPDTCSGKAWVTVTGGTSPYAFYWTPSSDITDTISNQCPGQNCCLITDNNGCVDSTCVTLVTGIATLSNSTFVSVYPNPNNGSFTIESSGLNGKATVEVYNILGEQVLGQIITGSTNQITLGAQPSGVYLYRILNQTGSVISTGKFVVQK